MISPTLSNNSNNQVMILDLENRILEVSGNVIMDTGLSAEELVGRSYHDVFFGQSYLAAECPLQAMLESGISQSCSMVVKKFNTKLQVSVYPICDAGGAIEKILYIAVNIAKQPGTEEETGKHPHSSVEQPMQSTTALTHEEVIEHTKTIRDNFNIIVKSVCKIQSEDVAVIALQKTIHGWEKKEKPLKPGKRRLNDIMNTLESASHTSSQADGMHFLYTYLKTYATEIEQAKDIMITANMRMVFLIAGRYKDKGLSFNDLVQEGCVGLMRAVFRFDYTAGRRFSTYASWWVRQAMIRSIPEKGRIIKLPSHFLVSCNQFKKALGILTNKLGRRPTVQELAEETRMSHREIVAIIEANTGLMSLDEPVGESSNNLMHILENSNASLPDDAALTVDFCEQIGTILDKLSAREGEIVRLRFGIGCTKEFTLEEVGARFNVSGERIRQIEKVALGRLRHHAYSGHMRCYLDS